MLVMDRVGSAEGTAHIGAPNPIEKTGVIILHVFQNLEKNILKKFWPQGGAKIHIFLTKTAVTCYRGPPQCSHYAHSVA